MHSSSVLLAQGNESAEADRLFEDGLRLFQEGSAASLRQAAALFEQARQQYRVADNQRGEVNALLGLGRSADLLGDREQALTYYNQALPLSRAVGDRAGEATTIGNLAVLYRDQGDSATALRFLSSYVELVEELRTQAGSSDLKTSYFASVQNYYQFKVDLEMQLGQTQDAFETSERTRSRSLIELLAESSIDFSAGVDDSELQAPLNEERNLLAQRDAQYNLLGTVPEAEQETVRVRIRDLDQQLDRLKATLRREHPAYANLEYPQPLTLQQVQRSVLDEDTVLLQYALGADHSYLFVVTPATFDAYTLAGRSDIELAANSFQSHRASSQPCRSHPFQACHD